jgi:NADH-quinone oxidoreductase subunit E
MSVRGARGARFGRTRTRTAESEIVLNEAERREIEFDLAHYAQPRAAAIEALMTVQRHRGWVSNEALADVAGALGMSVHELDAVATFYNLIFRRPVGRHVVWVCDSVSCWVMGCDALFEHAGHRLGIRPGETTADGELTLLPIVCLGFCDHAPAVLIDGELVGEVTPEKLDGLLREPQEVRPVWEFEWPGVHGRRAGRMRGGD